MHHQSDWEGPRYRLTRAARNVKAEVHDQVDASTQYAFAPGMGIPYALARAERATMTQRARVGDDV